MREFVQALSVAAKRECNSRSGIICQGLCSRKHVSLESSTKAYWLIVEGRTTHALLDGRISGYCDHRRHIRICRDSGCFRGNREDHIFYLPGSVYSEPVFRASRDKRLIICVLLGPEDAADHVGGGFVRR